MFLCLIAFLSIVARFLLVRDGTANDDWVEGFYFDDDAEPE